MTGVTWISRIAFQSDYAAILYKGEQSAEVLTDAAGGPYFFLFGPKTRANRAG